MRIKKEDYANNAEANLYKVMMYEELAEDPSKETEMKVVKFVEKLEENGHIAEKTANFIISTTELPSREHTQSSLRPINSMRNPK